MTCLIAGGVTAGFWVAGRRERKGAWIGGGLSLSFVALLPVLWGLWVTSRPEAPMIFYDRHPLTPAKVTGVLRILGGWLWDWKTTYVALAGLAAVLVFRRRGGWGREERALGWMAGLATLSSLVLLCGWPLDHLRANIDDAFNRMVLHTVPFWTILGASRIWGTGKAAMNDGTIREEDV